MTSDGVLIFNGLMSPLADTNHYYYNSMREIVTLKLFELIINMK